VARHTDVILTVVIGRFTYLCLPRSLTVDCAPAGGAPANVHGVYHVLVCLHRRRHRLYCRLSRWRVRSHACARSSARRGPARAAHRAAGRPPQPCAFAQAWRRAPRAARPYVRLESVANARHRCHGAEGRHVCGIAGHVKASICWHRAQCDRHPRLLAHARCALDGAAGRWSAPGPAHPLRRRRHSVARCARPAVEQISGFARRGRRALLWRGRRQRRQARSALACHAWPRSTHRVGVSRRRCVWGAMLLRCRKKREWLEGCLTWRAVDRCEGGCGDPRGGYQGARRRDKTGLRDGLSV
jgi:hypothetical protein